MRRLLAMLALAVCASCAPSAECGAGDVEVLVALNGPAQYCDAFTSDMIEPTIETTSGKIFPRYASPDRHRFVFDLPGDIAAGTNLDVHIESLSDDGRARLGGDTYVTALTGACRTAHLDAECMSSIIDAGVGP